MTDSEWVARSDGHFYGRALDGWSLSVTKTHALEYPCSWTAIAERGRVSWRCTGFADPGAARAAAEDHVRDVDDLARLRARYARGETDHA